MKQTKIAVSKLRSFENNPYQVRDDAEMNTLIESIQMQGVLSPLIVRPIENTDEYEVVSGHRRLHAARKAGVTEVPALIYALDRDAAAIAVVDSNLHREHILPSEKAFAYKLKYEALKHQGTSCQVGTKLRTDEQIAENANESARQIQRYIRLTYLIPEFLEKMDNNEIALSVGVELSFLPEQFQYDVLEICEMNDCTPSYSQSWHLHQYCKDGALDKYLIFKTLSEEKANQRETIKVPVERLRDIIPDGFTVKQTEYFLIKAAEYYRRYLQKQRENSR